MVQLAWHLPGNYVCLEFSVLLNDISCNQAHASQPVRGLQERAHAEPIRRAPRSNQRGHVYLGTLVIGDLPRVSDRKRELERLYYVVDLVDIVLQLDTEVFAQFGNRLVPLLGLLNDVTRVQILVCLA